MGVVSSSVRFVLGGTFRGQRMVIESGLATDDGTTRSGLQSYENGNVQFINVPRLQGLVVKPLDGSTVRTYSIYGNAIGSMGSCVQVGRTQFAPYAPVQPHGYYAGHALMRYERQWVQIED